MVTTYETFTIALQFSYNISSDTKIIYSGKAALSVRTTMPGSTYQTFVDAVKIKAVTEFSNAFESFAIKRLAYCPVYELYWDLLTVEGVQNLSTFLLDHK
ncbi:MAG: hypothetical protein JXA54_11785 [Candidatus Heimdallarchaeota archaeon]|nr:hypothetical protein [Candidatus Heimdallarchaeota archaeon]